MGDDPNRVSGARSLLYGSLCSVHGDHSPRPTPCHLQAGPQDQSRRTVQLHVETACLPAGACHVIVLQEAQPSHWSHPLFHLRLQPHQVCSITRIALVGGELGKAKTVRSHSPLRAAVPHPRPLFTSASRQPLFYDPQPLTRVRAGLHLNWKVYRGGMETVPLAQMFMGELAVQLVLNPRTLRCDERLGLLPALSAPPAATASIPRRRLSD